MSFWLSSINEVNYLFDKRKNTKQRAQKDKKTKKDIIYLEVPVV